MFFPQIFKIKQKKESGFAAFFISILLLSAMFGIAISSSVLILGEQKISNNISFSNQAYYTAEAGIEDALIRLKEGMNYLPSYILEAGDASTTVKVLDVGGSRTITSNGQQVERFRKVQVVYEIDSDAIGFYYGAQMGDGGMVMGNNSRIKGNVFSNGSVTGGGTIENNIIVASSSNQIEDITIEGDAIVHNCDGASIGGTLYYVSGGSIGTCVYTPPAVDMGPDEIEPIPLPISEDQINEWKSVAFAGGFESNNVDISGTQTMGPIQIGTLAQPRDLTVSGSAILKLTGTIYVTGDISIGVSATTTLDASYGSLSGILIADGKIEVENNAKLTGSGQAGSYILLLSTSDSLDPANPAVDVRNNAGSDGGAIFYANDGLLYLKNGMKAREITGYKVQLENNAEIEYDSGLANVNFSSGPSAGWIVSSWGEVE